MHEDSLKRKQYPEHNFLTSSSLKLTLICKLNQRLGRKVKLTETHVEEFRFTCSDVGRRKKAQDFVLLLTELQPMRLAANIPEQEWEIKRFWRQQYWWKISNPTRRAILYCFLISGVSTRCFPWENCRAATQIAQQCFNICNRGNLTMSRKKTSDTYPLNCLLSIGSRRRFYWAFGHLECFPKFYLCTEHEKRKK